MNNENLETKPTLDKKLYRNPNLLVIYSVTLIAIMGVASLTPAFPRIVKAFDITPKEIGFLITVFTFPGIILTPVFGVLADRYTRKKILVPSLFLFALAGVACAFVRDYHLLLIMRFFQGVGAASIGALNITIVGDIFSGKERMAAMGYNASVLSMGTASYPIIGGVLATFGWFYPFYLPLLAIPVGLLVLFVLKNPEPTREQSLKKYLISAWQSLQNRKVIGIFIASLFTFIILYGSYLSYLPFLIGNRFHAQPFIIGLIMSSSSLTSAITSSQMRRLAKRFSEKRLIKAGFLLYVLVMLIIPNIHNIWLLLIPTLLYGTAQGINLPNLQTLLAGLAPMEQRGAIMSFNGMVLRTGQTLGPVIIGGFFAFGGIGAAFYAGAGCAFLIFILLLFMLK